LISYKLRLGCGLTLVASRHEANIGNKSFKVREFEKVRKRMKRKVLKVRKIKDMTIGVHFEQKKHIRFSVA